MRKKRATAMWLMESQTTSPPPNNKKTKRLASIIEFLILPEVIVAKRQLRSKSLVDYNKFIIMAGENYITLM